MNFTFLILLSFFITIDEVQLKDANGRWITVIRPDRRLDLTQEEPVVRFFNNGRVPAGNYENVRVSFTSEEGGKKKWALQRREDYAPALPVKKGAFIGVAFSFDRLDEKHVSADAVKEVRLVVDQDERVDTGKDIKLWY